VALGGCHLERPLDVPLSCDIRDVFRATPWPTIARRFSPGNTVAATEEIHRVTQRLHSVDLDPQWPPLQAR
jgi:hypothetical protein